jgi:hypothetical protein
MRPDYRTFAIMLVMHLAIAMYVVNVDVDVTAACQMPIDGEGCVHAYVSEAVVWWAV